MHATVAPPPVAETGPIAPPRGVRKAIVIWWLLLPLGLATIVALPGVLPPQYLFDAGYIRDHIASMGPQSGFTVGDSWGNTAYLYYALGIGTSHWAAAYATYFAAWIAVLVALALAGSGGRFWLLIPFALWHAVLVVFTGMHTKEMHAMPVMALLLFLAGERFNLRRVAVMAAIVIMYALFFRKYWAAIGALAAAFIVVRHRKWLPIHGGLAVLVIFVSLLVAYHVATGAYITEWRSILTEGRDLDLFSDTAFSNAFPPTNLLNDFANAMIALAHLTFPTSMLSSGKVQHLAFALWEIVNVAAFVVLIRRVWRNDDAPARLVFAAAWVVAFTLMQSTFEPDYGTFLRHQSTLLPLLAFIALETLWPAPRPVQAAGQDAA